MKAVKKIIKYPLIIVFMGFILLFTLLDILTPDRTRTDYETLSSAPKFSVKALVDNTFTPAYETYVNDQFIFRDEWIDVKSRVEWLLTKVENNGIIYGGNDQMFPKLYETDEEQLDTNLTALATFLERYPEKTSVLIAPVASNIYEDELPFSPPMIDENTLIDEIFATVEEAGATVVDARASLIENKSEYIYYRNDHHWTTLGAYYAYIEFASLNALEPFDLSEHTAVEVDGFLGTSYSKSKYFAAVPDVLTYYELDNTIKVGEEDLPIYDYEKLDTADKYAMFLQGNPGFATVLGDGEGKALVIKDSYANCFVPFMTENFATIDVVDFRFYNASVTQLEIAEEYDEILILYNSSTFAEDGNFAKISFN